MFCTRWIPSAVSRLLLGICLLAAGCRTPVDLEGEDHEVWFPVLRASVPLVPDWTSKLRDLQHSGSLADHYRFGEWDPEEITPTLSFDFEVSGGHGSFTQDLTNSQFIFLDGRTVGSSPVDVDFDLIAGSIATRGGFLLVELIRLEAIAGVGLQNFEVEATNETGRIYDATFSAGPLFGARGGLDLFSWLSLYAQASISFGWGPFFSTLDTVEVGAEISPAPGISIIAGWRRWGYEEDRDETELFLSDVDVQASGPMVGLKLTF